MLTVCPKMTDTSSVMLIILGDAWTEYNFWEHVASDVAVDQRFLPAQGLDTQMNLDKIAMWTKSNLMNLKESKTRYMICTRSRQNFTTRLTVNGKFVECEKHFKL